MTTTASLVTYERTDQIAVITLNRPEKLNAFTDDVVRELAARMRQFDTDPKAFVAILPGAFGVEVALTGRVFTAEEALAANAISRVSPTGEHVNVATELARLIAKNPPLSVRSTVRTRRWYMAERARHTEMQQTALNLHLTEDFREAARAFVEKDRKS